MAQRRGQVLPTALVLVVGLIALAAVATDATALLQTRQQGYRLATDAALQATRAGVDFQTYLAGGELWLDADVAQATALAVVADSLAAWPGGYTVRVEVLNAPTGGRVNNFPPHPNAQQWGGTTWELPEPGVGVYLELPATTLFLELLLGTPTRVHVFAAASVAQIDGAP